MPDPENEGNFAGFFHLSIQEFSLSAFVELHCFLKWCFR